MDHPQVVLDVARLVEQFRVNKSWGEITIRFRAGVPMNLVSAVDQQIRGPEQAAVANPTLGRKPNGAEYR